MKVHRHTYNDLHSNFAGVKQDELWASEVTQHLAHNNWCKTISKQVTNYENCVKMQHDTANGIQIVAIVLLYHYHALASTN